MNLSYAINTSQLKTFKDNTNLLLSFKEPELKNKLCSALLFIAVILFISLACGCAFKIILFLLVM